MDSLAQGAVTPQEYVDRVRDLCEDNSEVDLDKDSLKWKFIHGLKEKWSVRCAATLDELLGKADISLENVCNEYKTQLTKQHISLSGLSRSQ
jgi:hypothetical protein